MAYKNKQVAKDMSIRNLIGISGVSIRTLTSADGSTAYDPDNPNEELFLDIPLSELQTYNDLESELIDKFADEYIEDLEMRKALGVSAPAERPSIDWQAWKLQKLLKARTRAELDKAYGRLSSHDQKMAEKYYLFMRAKLSA